MLGYLACIIRHVVIKFLLFITYLVSLCALILVFVPPLFSCTEMAEMIHDVVKTALEPKLPEILACPDA